MQPACYRSSSHNDKGDEADITDNTEPKIVAKRLADLDTVTDAEVRHLAGLNCASPHIELPQTHMLMVA